ncbi:hypothetical protein M409DRAFT_37174 [Zasmidium cellare ATCC 36951]|uniref:U three protein 23 n=1 Tax=Zasmidium cellare ATCC 36951 TaxID=1080233 RepID=A0A6A6CD92_ZASCE|nr:uncharacterized protein M409DRAFT_37174 [Zasmidium cellare ATCC 36951]KAF2163892.1 hypothetical protein M409DRAFT_37174 [Zasmidium cellare ATCC 36951]
MKGKRSKQYRKLMHAYQLTFNFREPYQVLLTADIIQDAARFKMRLGSLLENTLHGEIKPMITQCCIRHLYNAPACPEKDAWIEVAKTAERRRCGHHELEVPLSARECLESVVDPKGSGNNRHRYVVASQEGEVRGRMREIAGVPLIYIARSVMILEPMARRSEAVREGEDKAKIRAGLKGRRGVAALSGAGQPAKKRKPKGPKGPNPLSVKKAKKENSKETEHEKSVIRKAAKKDPQAAEKAGLSAVSGEEGSEALKKRKRKRKPKEADAADGGD